MVALAVLAAQAARLGVLEKPGNVVAKAPVQARGVGGEDFFEDLGDGAFDEQTAGAPLGELPGAGNQHKFVAREAAVGAQSGGFAHVAAANRAATVR